MSERAESCGALSSVSTSVVCQSGSPGHVSAPHLAAALAPTLEVWWASYWWTLILLALLVGVTYAFYCSFGQAGLVAGIVGSGIIVVLVAAILYLSLWYWIQMIYFAIAAPLYDWFDYVFGGLW